MIGVYKITSPTNRVYIGSSVNIKWRVNQYKTLDCKNQTKLYRSLKKHDWSNHKFEIIEECSVEILLQRELYYGTLFNVLHSKKGLNCRLPKSMESYQYMSQETKNKIAKANKGRYIGTVKGHYESSLKKLNIEDVIKIKKLLVENKLTQLEISKIFNVSRKIIGSINTGKTYKTIGTDIDLSNSKKKYIKLTNEDYDMIMIMNKEGVAQHQIAKKFNVDQSHISRIISSEEYLKTHKRKEGV